MSSCEDCDADESCFIENGALLLCGKCGRTICELGPRCPECGADESSFLETVSDMICVQCGTVQEPLIDSGPPRVFADDPESQQRAVSRASTYNPSGHCNSLGSRLSGTRGGSVEAHPWMRKLEERIRLALSRVYQDDTPEAVLQNALAYCRQFYRCQQLEKGQQARRHFSSADKIVCLSVYLAPPLTERGTRLLSAAEVSAVCGSSCLYDENHFAKFVREYEFVGLYRSHSL